jgi:hypothetical protein
LQGIKKEKPPRKPRLTGNYSNLSLDGLNQKIARLFRDIKRKKTL